MISASVARPFEAFTQAFLAEAAAGRLVYATCVDCGRTIGYNRRLCECGSGRIAWQPASGTASIFSHATYRRTYSENFPSPYTVVRVALTEGPRLSALWADPVQPVTGAHVRLGFDTQGRLLAFAA